MPRQKAQHLATTVYLPLDVAEALKTLAADTGETAGSLIVRAVGAFLSDSASDRHSDRRAWASLRQDVDALKARLDAIENRNQASAARTASGHRPLVDAETVRNEVKKIIHELQRPVAHAELKALLEDRFTLPGKRPTENLRTILVHPKASGFRLIRGQGYVID